MAQNSGSDILPFTKKNYFIMGAGGFLVALGYIIMSTEKFVDASEFSLSLNVCPWIIAAGLVVVGYGIMARSKGSASEESSQQ